MIYPVPREWPRPAVQEPTVNNPLTTVVSDEAPIRLVVAGVGEFTRKSFALSLVFGAVAASKVFLPIPDAVAAPEVIPNLVTAGTNGNLRAPTPKLQKGQDQKSRFYSVTPDPVPPEQPTVFATVGLTRAAPVVPPSRVYFVVADAAPPPEEPPLFVVANTSSQVRKPANALARYEARVGEVIFFVPAPPEVPLPSFVNAGLKKVAPTPPSKVFLVIADAPPPPAVEVPDLVVSNTSLKTRSPAPSLKLPGLRQQPQLFFAHNEVQPETPIDLVVAGVDSKTRKPISRLALGKTQGSLVTVVAPDFVPPPVEVPDLIVAQTGAKVRKPILQLRYVKVQDNLTMVVTPDSVGVAEVPDLIVTQVGSKVRKPFLQLFSIDAQKNLVQPFTVQTPVEVIPTVVSGSPQPVRVIGQKPQFFFITPDIVIVEEPVPLLVQTNAGNYSRTGVLRPQHGAVVKGQIVVPPFEVVTPPSTWRLVTAFNLETGEIMKLWVQLP